MGDKIAHIAVRSWLPDGPNTLCGLTIPEAVGVWFPTLSGFATCATCRKLRTTRKSEQ